MNNPSNIEMVFLDIDGTIYTDGEIMPSAVQAVGTLLERKMPVAICTGRSVLHARHVQQALQVPYGIYFNGGLVKNQTDEIFSTPFDVGDVREIISYAKNSGIYTIVHTHRQAMAFAPVPDDFKPILASFDFPNIDIVESADEVLAHEGIYQINAFMTSEWDSRFEERYPACYVYRWNERAVDFQRRKSDKSIGALQLLNHLGIDPRHAVHIGDGGNDIGMFKTVGYSYAMGNAEDDVKQAAQKVTKNVNEDGAALALQELGLI